jgi:hypothetical protein
MKMVLNLQNQDLDSTVGPSRTMAGILIERDTLNEMKRVAAALHYASMSEMVRIVMREWLNQVKNKEKEKSVE